MLRRCVARVCGVLLALVEGHGDGDELRVDVALDVGHDGRDGRIIRLFHEHVFGQLHHVDRGKKWVLHSPPIGVLLNVLDKNSIKLFNKKNLSVKFEANCLLKLMPKHFGHILLWVFQ